MDDEQRNALDALLRFNQPPCPFFEAVPARAKSFVPRGELVEQIRQSDRRVIVLAPQRQQASDMESAGFRRQRRLPIF